MLLNLLLCCMRLLITIVYVAYSYAVFDRLGTILPSIMSVWPK
jgi:hypothetical protein